METARNVKLYVSYTFFFEACQLLIRKKIIQFKHTLVLRSKCSRGVTLMTDSVLTFDLWHARVVSYYGSQPLNQACNLLIDSPCKSLLQSSSSNSWHYTNKEPLHAMDLKSHTWQYTGYHSSIGEPTCKLVAQDSKDSSDVHGFKDHQIKELITDC